MGGKRAEELTLGDRFVTALMCAIFAFATMLVVWFVVLYAGGRHGDDVALPFYWVWIVTGLSAAASFAAGPERSMDSFGKVWRMMGLFFQRGD